MNDSSTPDSTEATTTAEPEPSGPWYTGVTRYQWLVLAIASAGWVFDVFEGQLFAVYKTPAMNDVLGEARTPELVDRYSNYAFASFLVGGALGGLVFGVLADRIGRRKTMVLSILVYSLFTGFHYFASTWWHIVALRFFVAMGVGGEWAIAASLVSEVFPKRARAAAGGIFHASSVLGAIFASLCGMFLADADWRIAFLIGLTPALLILWIRASLKESERWEQTRTSSTDGSAQKLGSLSELLGDRRWRGRALLGLCLASIGLGTYWGIYAWGPELARDVLKNEVPRLTSSQVDNRVRDVLQTYAPDAPHSDYQALLQETIRAYSIQANLIVENGVPDSNDSLVPGSKERREAESNVTLLEDALRSLNPDGTPGAESESPFRDILATELAQPLQSKMGSFAYLMMNFTGGLLGLLCFAPLASIAGRRKAFILYHAGALVMAPVTFLIAASYLQTVVLLSVMAFFVVGMHAGYAIYFPELFPTRLRATGASFCFNLGRLISAGMLLTRGSLRAFFAETYGPSLGLRYAVSAMALLFAVGLVLAMFAPETKDQELED